MIRFVARQKVYAQRAMQYLTFPQAAILLDVWLGAHGWGRWFWPALLSIGLSLLVFGYLERLMGIPEAETEYVWGQSPQLRSIVRKLDNQVDSMEGWL